MSAVSIDDRGERRDALLGILGAVVRFVLTLAVTLVGLLAVTFFIGRVMPVDPVLAIVGDRASASTYARARAELGLDLPLMQQFWVYAVKAVTGDFGTSVLTTKPVMQDIARVFPATLELATLATLVGTVLGVPLGIAAAVRRGSWIDQIARLIGLIGYSIPVFWLGLMSLVLFYAKLGWVEGPGRLDIAYDYIVSPVTGMILVDSAMQGEWEAFRNAVSHIILPALTLSYYAVAFVSRMTRSFMLTELSQEYVTTARVKGLSETRVVLFHALRNAAVPLVTVIALSYAYLLEGSVLTETVFAWPGLGQYMTNSLQNADLNAVLGGTLVIGAVFVCLNLFSDLLYRMLDPRVRMTMDAAPAGWRAWLLSPEPQSVSQARLSRLYLGWIGFSRNPLAMIGLGIIVALVLVAAFAPWLSSYSPVSGGDLRTERLLAPGAGGHLLGTDDQARDITSRLVHGSRLTLFIVVLVTVIATPIGLAVGTIAGYIGGAADAVLMRITDIFLAFPRLILALAFVAALGPGMENAIIAIALTAWPPYARLARAETLTIRRTDFIAAAKLQGASTTRVIFRHIVPLCLSSLVVRATLDMAGVILTAAALGFLGLGAQPPLPEWGAMIATGRRYLIDQWWLAAAPGAAIFIVSLGFNLFGDGLRDVLDPKAAR